MDCARLFQPCADKVSRALLLSTVASMAEASRMFQTALTLTLPPPFSQTPSRHSQPVPRRHPIRCSISSTDTVKTSVTQKIPWGCEVDSLENAAVLQKWLSDSGLPPQKMGIERVEVGERGLVALKNIRKGEKLLFVPPSLVICADSVSFSSKIAVFFHWKIL